MATNLPRRAWLVVALALSLASCKDDEEDFYTGDGAVTNDGGRPADGGAEAGIDAGAGGMDGGSVPDAGAVLKACLDRPEELPRPPSGELPCELLPPGFSR